MVRINAGAALIPYPPKDLGPCAKREVLTREQEVRRERAADADISEKKVTV